MDNWRMETTTIYVRVGKQVRRAEAKIRNGKAVIVTTSGPVEFRRWHLTERAAKAAAKKGKR